MEDKLATKSDLQKEIQEVKTELRELRLDVQQLDKKIDTSISQVKADLTVRMGTMMAGAVATIVALQKLL